MLFNSPDFAVFLPIVFFIYWFAVGKSLRLQNLFVVVASCVFYGWWSRTFLLLMGITTFCSWLSGVLIFGIRGRGLGERKEKKLSLFITAANIIINLSILGVFKYYNFFAESFNDAFSLFGKQLNIHSLKLILPVGISFYTFQALSYTIDVHRKKIAPIKDILPFFAFISFFPLLVAGPIERATNLLWQFQQKRVFNYDKAVDGLRQILWGLVKKIVIADNCAKTVNVIFENSGDCNGSTLLLGAFFFAFQIYGDFSGYSDIARGVARLFGIDAMRNFNYPYFSRDIAEFWRRWHISLSTWFRDYLYIPLGGSKGGKWMQVRNTFIIFLVSGFWHGANWTFIAWGAYHAMLFLPLLLTNTNRKNRDNIAEGKIFPTPKEAFQIFATFGLVSVGWVFFRADSLAHALDYLSGMFSMSLFSVPEFSDKRQALITLALVFGFICAEWLGRNRQFALERLGTLPPHRYRLVKYAIYYGLIFLIFCFVGKEQAFIYFQF